jgi:diguanylate cyclase (GGDEF)-like protein
MNLGRDDRTSGVEAIIVDEVVLTSDAGRGVASLLEPGALIPVFQPIVRVTDGAIVGYEALSRSARDVPGSPEDWFAVARAEGFAAELDAACLRAIATAGAPPGGRALFVNVTPTSLASPEVVAARELLPDRLVIELTEQEVTADIDALSDLLVRWSRLRVRIALDDVGAGYAELRQIVRLQPEFLKLDRSLITGIEGSRTRQALVASLLGFARQAGTTILAEGVETQAELRWLAEAGVPLAQGFLFARPGEPWPDVSGSRHQGRTSRTEHRLIKRLERAQTVRQACEAAAEHLFSFGSLMPSIYLEAGGRLRCQAQRGLWQVLDGMETAAGITGRTFRTGTTHYIADVSLEPEYLEAIPGVVAEMCTPIGTPANVIGSLNVESLTDIPKSVRDAVEQVAQLLGRRLVELPSDTGAIPLRRLASTAAALVAVPQPAATAHAVVTALCDLTAMDSGAVVLMSDDGTHRVIAPRGPLQEALAAMTERDVTHLVQILGPLSSCYSSGEATGLAFVGGDSLRTKGACAVIALPLMAHGRRTGLVVLGNTSPRALGPDVIEPAELLATLAASCLQTSRHLEELHTRAHVDALTGLANHARFHDALREHRGPLAIAMFDIDRFKQVNDTNGHLAGDEVLRATAEAMRRHALPSMELYRVGGDEFAAILSTTEPAAVSSLIQQVVRAAQVVLEPHLAGLSAGIAIHHAGETILEALARADQALYSAKRSGDGTSVASA